MHVLQIFARHGYNSSFIILSAREEPWEIREISCVAKQARVSPLSLSVRTDLGENLSPGISRQSQVCNTRIWKISSRAINI